MGSGGCVGRLGLIKEERWQPKSGIEDRRKKSKTEKIEIETADPNANRAEIDKSNFL